MGVYLEPEDAKLMTQSDALRLLDVSIIDEMYVIPAESVLQQALRLEVNTDGEPWKWAGTFDERPDLRTRYWADCRRATQFIVDRMALNPHGFSSQSSAGISVSYGGMVPDQARSIMAQWAKTGSVFRA